MEYKYENRIVAFIDILGFKDMVSKSVDSIEVWRKIYNAVKTILDVKRINDRFKLEYDIQKPFEATVSTFSDSIVISYPVGPYGNLFQILLDIIHLQLNLAFQGVLIRGGLTIGMVYHDEQMVFGPAMNEAYMLESRYAKYPRIITTENTLVSGIKLTTDSHHSFKEEADFIRSLIKRDKDTYWYMDYLRQYGELDYPEGDYYHLLSGVRIVIQNGLSSFPKGNPVREKFVWMKTYFNNVINNLESVPDPSDWYEGDAIMLYRDLEIV